MLDELEAITSYRDGITSQHQTPHTSNLNVTKDRRRRPAQDAAVAPRLAWQGRVRVLKGTWAAAAGGRLVEGAAPATGKKQEAKGKAARVVAATGPLCDPPPVPPKLVIDNDDGRPSIDRRSNSAVWRSPEIPSPSPLTRPKQFPLGTFPDD